MDVRIESAQPHETAEASQAEISGWTKFAGNETGKLPAGIEAGTPIAIRLCQGAEHAVFASDSFELPLGEWDHIDHEKDIVAYRLMSAKESRELIEAQAVTDHVSEELTKMLDQCEAAINDLQAKFSNPLLEYMMPKLAAALHTPGSFGYRAATANIGKSGCWVLQQAMPAFSEPSKD
ncbi:hypothetical protein [Microbulbifer discodermiae]|uniref:hypothetical protein n=1 Tax=Microbulbifer sp. 2201CG32-9 TaxID=3232309 RepID=UPI00345BC58B